MTNKPSVNHLRKICFNNELIVQKLLNNMKAESTLLYADYTSTNEKSEKIRIVHKSVTLFSMIGMTVSANQAKTYENNLACNSDVGRKEFEESLLIAINFLK